jgi:uroporphyrinogen-III synthase
MAAAHLTTYAFVVFISPNAVGYGLSILLAGRVWPEAVKVAAIGPGTVAALAACGVTGTIAPRERFDSEALLSLPEFGAAAEPQDRLQLARLPLFVPHARIVDEAAKLGLTQIVLTGPADAGILEGLVAFQGFCHE